jgi:BirA family biotin operon repressor/biotin-[acetyl-CoA-carboxylase] ligase
MTLIVPDAPELPGWIGLSFGEALLECCREALPATIRPAAALKWPNDIMIGDHKVAGILTERLRAVGGGGGDVLLVGVGVNANVESGALPLELHGRSTSLAVYGTAPVDLAALATCIARLVLERVKHPPDGATLASRLGKSLWGRGRTMPITLPDGRRIEGQIEGLSTDGALLAIIDGEHREVRSADAIG